jgi:hypothetical protein
MGLLAWHPLGFYGPFNVIQGILGATEVFIGCFVELATIFFFRSVIYNGRTGFNLKDLGFYEYAAMFTAAWSIIVHSYGVYGIATLTQPINYNLYPVLLFFLFNASPSLLWFESFVCLSMVSSLEEVKNNRSASNTRNTQNMLSNNSSVVAK